MGAILRGILLLIPLLVSPISLYVAGIFTIFLSISLTFWFYDNFCHKP